MVGAAFGLGFIIGPAAGGVLGAIDPRLPFWAAAGLSLTNAMYGFFVLPESLGADKRAAFSWMRANPVGSLQLLRSYPGVLSLSGVAFLSRLAHDVLPSTFVLYAGYRYGWGEREVGFTMAGVGVCASIVQAGLVRPIVARIGERATLLFGLTLGAIGFATYGLASEPRWFLLGIPIMSLWGLSGPAVQGLMSRRVDPTAQGRLQGAVMSMGSLAGLLGPGLFTQTFATFIAHEEWHFPGAAFVLASLLLVTAAVLAEVVTRGDRSGMNRAGTTQVVATSATVPGEAAEG
jgi:DHA1 family tetracycline resistance protein-like MFS transporter